MQLWAMNERPSKENKYEKLGFAAHGIGSILIILGGFGMLASIYPNNLSNRLVKQLLG